MSRPGCTSRAPQRAKQVLQLACLFVVVTTITAAGDQLARFNNLGHQMMCVCGCNQILLECNHVGCQYSDVMRNELMAAVSRGDSDSLVQQGFVQKYGPMVLAAPPATGFGKTAWVVPFAALGLGVIAVGAV